MKNKIILVALMLLSVSCGKDEYWPMYSFCPSEGETILIHGRDAVQDVFDFYYGTRLMETERTGLFPEEFDIRWDGEKIIAISTQDGYGLSDLGEVNYYEVFLVPDNLAYTNESDPVNNHVYIIKSMEDNRPVYSKFIVLDQKRNPYQNYGWIKFRWERASYIYFKDY